MAIGSLPSCDWEDRFECVQFSKCLVSSDSTRTLLCFGTYCALGGAFICGTLYLARSGLIICCLYLHCVLYPDNRWYREYLRCQGDANAEVFECSCCPASAAWCRCQEWNLWSKGKPSATCSLCYQAARRFYGVISYACSLSDGRSVCVEAYSLVRRASTSKGAPKLFLLRVVRGMPEKDIEIICCWPTAVLPPGMGCVRLWFEIWLLPIVLAGYGRWLHWRRQEHPVQDSTELRHPSGIPATVRWSGCGPGTASLAVRRGAESSKIGFFYLEVWVHMNGHSLHAQGYTGSVYHSIAWASSLKIIIALHPCFQ